MKADGKQWSFAVLLVLAVLLSECIVICWGVAWYWAATLLLLEFLCLNYFINKRSDQRLDACFSGRPILKEEEFGKYYFPPDQIEIAMRLRKILLNHVGIDISRMNPTDRFIEDLLMDEFDSMSTVEFIIEIETEFKIRIPDSAAEKMTNFQSVVDFVAETLKQKTGRT